MKPKFWFSPEPGSDIVQMFRQAASWSTQFDAFALTDHHLRPRYRSGEGSVIKENKFPRLVKSGMFQVLKDRNILFGVEAGAVKPGIHHNAKIYAGLHAKMIKRVHKAGGQIAHITIDWPRASGKDENQPAILTATYVAQYIKTVRQAYEEIYPDVGLPHRWQKHRMKNGWKESVGRLKFGLYEGYPFFDVNELADWLNILDNELMNVGVSLDYFLLDVDIDHHNSLKKGPNELRDVLQRLERTALDMGWKFGPVIWSNEIHSPSHYRNAVLNWAELVQDILPTPDIVCVNSWEYWVQQKNYGDVFPANLLESDPYSHLHLLQDVKKIWGC